MRISCLVFLGTLLLFTTGAFHPPVLASSVRAESADNAWLPRILFGLSESPGRKDTSPKMKFTLSTDGPYSCQILKASVSLNEDVVRLGPVIAVPLSGPCPPSVVPATGAVPVSLKPGRYQLIVVIGKQEDRYTIQLTESTITIRP